MNFFVLPFSLHRAKDDFLFSFIQKKIFKISLNIYIYIFIYLHRELLTNIHIHTQPPTHPQKLAHPVYWFWFVFLKHISI